MYELHRRNLLLHRICELVFTDKLITENKQSLKLKFTMHNTHITLGCYREVDDDVYVDITGDLECHWVFKSGTHAADFALQIALFTLKRFERENEHDRNLRIDSKVCSNT